MRIDIKTEPRVSPFRTMRKERFLTAEELLSTKSPAEFGETELPLKELSITGLLSFGEKTVFEFGRLNILIGPNG